jgi:hypothetical protein
MHFDVASVWLLRYLGLVPSHSSLHLVLVYLFLKSLSSVLWNFVGSNLTLHFWEVLWLLKIYINAGRLGQGFCLGVKGQPSYTTI